MLRFYKDFVAKLLFGLLYLKDRGVTPAQLSAYVRDRSNEYPDIMPSGKIEDLAYFAQDAGEALSTEEMAKQIVDQLDQKRNDIDLIDTIVNTLGLPYFGNAMDATALENLRKAILLPDELTGLKTKLSNIELHCGSCMRRFIAGEMVTIGINASKLPIIYCILCSPPKYIACSVCNDHQASVPLSVAKGIAKKGMCIHCEDAKAKGITKNEANIGERPDFVVREVPNLVVEALRRPNRRAFAHVRLDEQGPFRQEFVARPPDVLQGVPDINTMTVDEVGPMVDFNWGNPPAPGRERNE